MTDFQFKDRYTFDDLMSIIKILRAPDGCPWDSVQTHKSIRRNFIEETCEAVEAIDTDNPTLLCEELGDVLMQVALHSSMSEDEGTFTIADVTDGVCKKLIFRHPHIFSDGTANNVDEVLTAWDNLKRIEKDQQSYGETVNSVARTLPALWRAEKMQSKAEKSGMTAMSENETVAELLKSTALLADASEDAMRISAAGDLLFAAVRLLRLNGIDGEVALNAAADRFAARFERAEKSAQRSLDDMSDSEKSALWNSTK